MKKAWLIFFLLVYGKSNAADVSSLNNLNWQFRKSGDAKWWPATVPGTIHTDLLANKIIDDPYFGDNEQKLQWVDTCNWEYQTFFDCDKNTLSNAHIELEFEGLDTYAKVFLNDSLILSADNMFRTWRVDCERVLKEKGNHLLVQFESAITRGKKAAKDLSYTLPGDEKIFTRKAAYHYGWDWGPRFVTCGIWRSVKLVAWNKLRIESLRVVEESQSHTLAELRAVFEINSDIKRTITIHYMDLVREGRLVLEFFRRVEVVKGLNRIECPFSVNNPKLWWCNGMGEPDLYHYNFSIEDGKNILDQQKISFGLRKVELVQQTDSIGKSFYFRLNGIPVFMKGANYIPPDNFLPRVSQERYNEIIHSATEANMNMIRVWGGGIYEDDAFYNLCDEKGILVWQDFMFACAMYPGDPLFVENVKQEVTDNVKRLRNHPCIALWCGNNEVDEGWKNWGWQKQYHYSVKDSANIWNDYVKLFQNIIPSLLNTLLGQSPIPRFPNSAERENGRAGEPMNASYISSSPSIGWGHDESLQQGDSHYWGVWWGMEPFDVYKKKVGRFMSEYGFQGMPSLNAFKKFCDEKDLSLSSSRVKNHQKHPTGYATIQTYLERQYKQPKDFENYVYVSQLLQAEGIRTAIEAHRRAKPYCMGTLYWQLNDCWPVTSWSSTDYFGEWKALHYFVKKAYEKYLVSADNENGNLVVNVVSDDVIDLKAKGKFQLIDFDGNILWTDSIDVSVTNAKSEKVFSIVLAKLLAGNSLSHSFFKMKIEKDNSVLTENIYYFVEPKELTLDKPDIQYTISGETAHTAVMELSTDKLAKNIFIEVKDEHVTVSDNYFDLLPGEKKTIMIGNKMNTEGLLKKIKIKSLFDTY